VGAYAAAGITVATETMEAAAGMGAIVSGSAAVGAMEAMVTDAGFYDSVPRLSDWSYKLNETSLLLNQAYKIVYSNLFYFLVGIVL